jgi:hypothetical protein
MRQSLRQKFAGTVARFTSDRQGGVAVIFAAAGFSLCLLVAGSLELYRRSLATAVMQKATDAAALAAKRIESDSRIKVSLAEARAEGEAQARALFKAVLTEDGRVFGASIPVPNVEWLNDGSVKVSAAGRFEMLLGGLLPNDFAQVETKAVVGHGVPLPTEVALVLDNTASMFNRDANPNTRFTQLRDAAKMFTHTLFDAAQQVNDNNFLRMSVIPWTTTVNVKSEAPRPADFAGSASVSSIPDKGTQTTVSTPLSRAGKVSVNEADFAPVGWRGCISGQNEDRAAMIGAASTWNALLIPQGPLSTSSLGQGDIKPVTYRDCKWRSRDDGNTNCGGGGPTGPTGPTGGGGTQGFNDILRRVLPQASYASMFGDRPDRAVGGDVQNACVIWEPYDCQDKQRDELVCDSWQTYLSCSQDYYGGRRNAYLKDSRQCTNGGCFKRGTAPAPISLPGCVGDPNEPGIKSGSVKWCPWMPTTDWTKFDPISGPNLNCPAPMLGLSGNRRQILETLDRMTPVPGGTHADVGLRWGMRSLAPEGGWPAFFGLAKPPVAFGGQEKKVMILITDGSNEQAIDYPGYWGCSNTGNPGCTTSPNKAALDTMMMNWCQEIRTRHNVELFTIAVKIRDPGALNLLRSCAGVPDRFYSVDAAELKNVLNIIAGSIIRLRILS